MSFQPSEHSEYGTPIISMEQAQLLRHTAWVVTPLFWGMGMGILCGLIPTRKLTFSGGLKTGLFIGTGIVAYTEFSGNSKRAVDFLTTD